MESIWDTVDFFEREIAAYCGSKYAVATDSCTNSIFLCLKYLNNPCEVVIPSRTYVSVPMAVKHAGYSVKFKDKEWEGSYLLENTPIIDSACEFKSNLYKPNTFCCLSFHFKKLIPIGRGGMILTDDSEAADWLRKARYDGRPSYFYNDMLSTNIDVLGYHMYMTPEMASRGIEQFYRAKTAGITTCGSSKEFAVDLSKLNIFAS
jgi:dTDP-4-amino-4,6-dideoxygalactose transaminase